MTIGIPYARVDHDDVGFLVQVCPVCGARCPFRADDVGELMTGTYADHYAEAHARRPADPKISDGGGDEQATR
jgi:hypothetical protein